MKKTLRWLARAAGILLGIVAIWAIGGTLIYHLKPSVAVPSDPIESRLHGRGCDIWDDPQGIPHARAGGKTEALACLGYFHGRARAWQMDLFKRTWEGRKSEVLGPSEVRSDFTMRLLDLKGRAETLYNSMPSDMREWLRAYSYGVNRGTREAMAQGSYEFTELGYLPEVWRPQDSIALLLLQAFDQTKESFVRQIDENDFAGDWGDEAPALFSRAGVPWDTTILKPGEQDSRPMLQSRADRPNRGLARSHPVRLADTAWAKFLKHDLGGGIGQGSNNWVIAPARSATGNAWLANDPHLELKHPPFWYWLHIESPEFDVIGASLPGVPVIASGANRHVAWGVTNSYLNVSRLAFVPEQDLGPGSKTERPVIWIKLGPLRLPFFFKTLQRTAEAWPVLPIEAPAGRVAVLRWTGFEVEPEDFRGVFELFSTQNAAEADRALSRFRVPSWNFVFADDRGKIGYRAVGKVPDNRDALPFGIPLLSLAQLRGLPAFAHFLSPVEMPHLLAPARGYLATANNRQWPEPQSVRLGRAQSESFRAFRIEELLRATPKHGLDSNRKIQCDVQAVDARFLLPELLKVLGEPRDSGQKASLEVLRSWDGVATLACQACPVFQRWVDRLLTDQDLDDTSLFRKLRENDPNFNREVQEAFAGALDDLGYRAGGRLPTWGEVHLNYFSHMAGRDRFVAKPVATGGDDHSVNPGSSEWEGGIFRHTTGASQRMIVELASPPRVYSVLAGSNGDLDHRDLSAPGSEWRKWLDCEQQRREFPLDWSKLSTRRLEW